MGEVTCSLYSWVRNGSSINTVSESLGISSWRQCKICSILQHPIKGKEERAVYLLISYYFHPLLSQQKTCVLNFVAHRKWVSEPSRQLVEKPELHEPQIVTTQMWKALVDSQCLIRLNMAGCLVWLLSHSQSRKWSGFFMVYPWKPHGDTSLYAIVQEE